jgi:RNA polymerase sigma-70 factor (ECF subfamily)
MTPLLRRLPVDAAMNVAMEPSAVQAMPFDAAPPVATPPTTSSVEELFRKHARFVAKFLARLGVPPGDVDDQVQEVFLIVHRKGFVLTGARPTTFLASIAHKVASTARRTQARRHLSDEEGVLDVIVSQAPDPHARADVNQSLTRVGRALGTLDFDKRVAFVLFEIEGMSCPEVAEALELSVGTVYSRLHAARAAFKKAYDREARRCGR